MSSSPRRPLLIFTDRVAGVAGLERWVPTVMIGAISLSLLATPLLITTRKLWWLPALLGSFGLSASVLLAVHLRAGKNRRIEIDFDARTIAFYNFRIARAFSLGLKKSPLTIIGFDEVFAAQSTGHGLTIITMQGRVLIHSSAEGFYRLRSALAEISREAPPPPFVYTMKFAWLIVLVPTALAILGVCVAIFFVAQP
jgi:hypothetical protein